MYLGSRRHSLSVGPIFYAHRAVERALNGLLGGMVFGIECSTEILR
jgi:hypothetical protein